MVLECNDENDKHVYGKDLARDLGITLYRIFHETPLHKIKSKARDVKARVDEIARYEKEKELYGE